MSQRKNVLTPYHIISSGDMSGNITSAPTGIQFLDSISIQLNYSGSPVGGISIEASLDYEPGTGGTVLNAGTWNALTLTPSPTVSGAGSTLIDLFGLSFPYIRIKYTATSGSGSLDAYISGKEI